MALSSSEITTIHLRRLATKDKKYYSDDDKVYLGNPNGTLKLLDKAINTTFKPTLDIPEDNVQDAIEEASSDITNLITVVNNNYITQNIAIEEAKCLSVAMALIL